VVELEVKEKVTSLSCLVVSLAILLLCLLEPENISSIADFFNWAGVFLCFIFLSLSPQIFYLPFKSAMTGNARVLFVSKINHTRLGLTGFSCCLLGTICRLLL
jgi:hypothetical protein